MRRLAVAALLVAFVSVLSCCTGVFFFSTNGTGSAFITVTGTVTVVNLTFTSDGNQITVVTLVGDGSAQTFNFCGNTVPQFPMDSFVTVNFTHNGPCNNVVHVH